MFDLGHPTIQCDRRLAGSFWRSHISIQPPPAHSLRTLSERSLNALLSLLSSLSCILFPQKCNTDPDEYNYHMMVWYLFSAMMHGTAAIQHKGMGRVHVAPKRERESSITGSGNGGLGNGCGQWEEGLTLLHTTVLARESLHTPAFTTVPLPDLRGIPGAPSIEREPRYAFDFTLIAPHICCIYIYSISLYTILPRLALTRRLFMPRMKDAARRARRRFSKRASQRERRSATTDSASLTTGKNPHLHVLRECVRTDGIKSQKGATRRPNARPGKVRAEN
jgi:hypothetical protein